MTKVDIWNAALAMLPHDYTILDENEESTEALRCRQQWDGCRRTLLASHPWGFAEASTPVLHGGTCDYHGHNGYMYPRPNGVIRIIGLFDAHGHKIKSDSINGVLVCDKDEASVRYVSDVTDVDMLPYYFVDALIALLASRISPMIKANPATDEYLRQEFMRRQMEAWGIDATEAEFTGECDNRYIAARR